MIKVISYYTFKRGESWSWSNGSWIYSYLCNQCPSPLSRSWWGAHDTTLCDKVGQWLAAGLWFSLGTPVSSTNLTEILLKVALNTITIHSKTYFLRN